MMSFIYHHAKRGTLTLAVVFLLTAPGFTNLGRAEMRYVYRTRYTKYPPNASLFRHVAVRLGDDSVGIFGGFGRGDMELFNPATEQFLTPPLTHWFSDHDGVALPDGRALLVDGLQDAIFDFERQDFVAPQNSYPGGHVRFPVLVPLADGRIFICGGTDDDCVPVAACVLFDPQTLQFRAVGQLHGPRFDHAAVALDDYRVLIAGGYNYVSDSLEWQALDTLEIFDTRTGLSTLLPTRLRQARFSPGSVRLPDNKVLLFGGGSSGLAYWLRSSEIFDPNTGTLTPGPELGLGRNRVRTAVLPSGRTAVFGGNYEARTVELYCPEAGTWALADRLMVDPRCSDFTATPLASGAVLLVGGHTTGTAEVVPNAEIFEETAQEVNVPPALDEWTDKWCVELWDGDTWQSTVWLRGYECPESRNVAHPHPYFTAILRATEEVSYTRLVVRFSKYAPYDARVRLFNLAGWTRVPEVILGPDLDVRPPEDLSLPWGSVGLGNRRPRLRILSASGEDIRATPGEGTSFTDALKERAWQGVGP